MHLYGIV